MDSQTALSPTDIVQADGDDLAGAESISGNQEKHRVVAQSHAGLRVYAFQERCDGVPRERARQLFQPVKPGRVNQAIQSSAHSTIGCKVSKQSANGGDLVLQTRATRGATAD